MSTQTPEITVEPTRVGQVIGGKYPVAVACQRCHLPAWRKAENEYVHSATIALDQKNNHKLTVHVACTVRSPR